jgi:hypothetical protein
MSRKFATFAILAIFLLAPVRLIAGGPPWLCLPVNGVSPDNEKACAELLTSKLKSKFSPHLARNNSVELRQFDGQWYFTFYMGEDVALGDVEAALKDSRFSVPRDRLRLFGHVILEIDARKSTAKELLDGLEALGHVSVGKSENTDGMLLVTLDMPYPVESNPRDLLSAGWEKFQRNDFASDQSTRSEPAATARTLPSYDVFRNIVARHRGDLKDIRWSTYHACRPQGGVVVAANKVATAY